MMMSRAVFLAVCLAGVLALSACATSAPRAGDDESYTTSHSDSQTRSSSQAQNRSLTRQQSQSHTGTQDRLRRSQTHRSGQQSNTDRTQAGRPLSAAQYAYAQLDAWQISDPRAALSAFQRSCKTLLRRPATAELSRARREYGTIADWTPACREASQVGRLSARDARAYFERHFRPLEISSGTQDTGLLTGYYQPEIPARLRPDRAFSEPILRVPSTASLKNRTRAQISANPKSVRNDVIAYGRPIDVFFMQVQGSGVLRLGNGELIGVGYAGNNNQRYSSIGRVLVDRGELSLSQASKGAIENWMAKAGPAKAQDLMNENARYIYFEPVRRAAGEGPKGAMGVPLTAMGSIAIDPKYYPYGVPVFINVNLPQAARDYKGQAEGLLLITQDTGSAIKGAMRGDIFFGSGDEAGQLAGVMKHRGTWAVLLPNPLADRLAPIG